jgi:hypothetical protein
LTLEQFPFFGLGLRNECWATVRARIQSKANSFFPVAETPVVTTPDLPNVARGPVITQSAAYHFVKIERPLRAFAGH